MVPIQLPGITRCQDESRDVPEPRVRHDRIDEAAAKPTTTPGFVHEDVADPSERGPVRDDTGDADLCAAMEQPITE